MFAYAAASLTQRFEGEPDPESNVLLEAFTVHMRCLRDFLWGDRARWKTDAFATDFCEAGAWRRARGDIPPALAEIDQRARAGREVVHLTYQRSAVPPDLKDWDCGQVFHEIADGLFVFAEAALARRLDSVTKAALQDLLVFTPDAGPSSVAIEMDLAGDAAVIPFEGFYVGS
jgi:hypothetical protein